MAYCCNAICVVFAVIIADHQVHTNVDSGVLYLDNCADHNNKDIICTVRKVDCTDETEKVRVSKSELVNEISFGSFVHDFRIEPYTRAVIHNAEQTSYQLSVDISWQIRLNNLTSLVLAFVLEVENSAFNRSCFYFDISKSHWNNQLLVTTPRLHFAIESLFEFDESYDIMLISLLREANYTIAIKKHVRMPQHPGFSYSGATSYDCRRTSNPQASRWTGGFRRILVHPVARTIQLEFVGAPAHYCFESYEVRLKDESGLELLHSAVVPVESMRAEQFDNQTILFGEHNFTELKVEQYYIPSVIPIERSRDGRCLCPVSSTNPFDSRVVCSCIAADWNKIRIQRVERFPPLAPKSEKNDILMLRARHNAADYLWTMLLAGLILGIGMLIFFLLYVAHSYYLRHRASGKVVQVRFVSNRPPSPKATTLSNSQAPLINVAQRNVLLIYSHDNLLHEKCVLAFAEYLRDVLGFVVQLDVWDIDEIERNIVDYISASIMNADKVVVVNSQGAYYHYRCKLQRKYRIERKEPQQLDDLFDKQIDQVLVHSSVISARCKYTPQSFVLPPLSYSLQYVIPDNIVALLSDLTQSNVKNDPRIVSYNLAYAKLKGLIAEMSELLENDPAWFVNSHYRVPRLLAADGQHRNVVRNRMNKLTDSKRAKCEKRNSGFGIQTTMQGETLLEEAEESELISVSKNSTAMSSGVVSDFKVQRIALENKNLKPLEYYDGSRDNELGTTLDQLDLLPIVTNPSRTLSSGSGHTLHDSGFISEKDFTNT